ncbi:hypothetical protein GCM10007973_10820 [Polymorphobacter multimanifer]|nr:hypothetical protein GCM10007973_10820 [Polymorphobacter multimanifer]
MQRVDDAGGGDDGGAMLVIVEDRDVHPLLERGLDDEALGRLDILEVDAAEARLHDLDGGDELVDILGRELQIDRIDIGEALEKHRLALHHRLRRQCAEVAEAEDCGAVGDDRDEVALDRVIIGGIRIGSDGAHRGGDAGGIGQAQIALGGHRLGGDDLDLAGPAADMEVERLAIAEIVALAAAAFFHCHVIVLPGNSVTIRA